MHRTKATLKRPAPHQYVDDPEAPGTCLRCHLPDNPDSIRNELHDPATVAAHEAAVEAKRQAHLERDEMRTGERRAASDPEGARDV